MKKIMIIILCLALVFSMTACKKDKESGAANAADQNDPAGTAEPVEDEAPVGEAEEPESDLVEFGEPMIYQWDELEENAPCFEFVVPVKNISDEYIFFGTNTYTLLDKDGNTMGVFEGADCAPMYIAPGQEGIIYYSAINRSGNDYLNPDYSLDYIAEPAIVSWDFAEFKVDNIQISQNLGDTEIHANLINATEQDYDNASVTFLFYDENGKILCGAYGMGGVGNADSDDFGILHAKTICPLTTYRYWMPNGYPLESVTVEGFAFGG